MGFRSRSSQFNRRLHDDQIKSAKRIRDEYQAERAAKVAEYNAKVAECNAEREKAQKNPSRYDGPLLDLYGELDRLKRELEMIRYRQGLNAADIGEATRKRYWS